MNAKATPRWKAYRHPGPLLARGHTGAEYDAWLINIREGDQFGSAFVGANPNSKIPALMDRSGQTPIRVFESGASDTRRAISTPRRGTWSVAG
jgi:glutathione S-transferase